MHAETAERFDFPPDAPIYAPTLPPDTHVTVTIRLSRSSPLFGVRVMVDSMAYALRATIKTYRDESGHLHFDLTPTTEAAR